MADPLSIAASAIGTISAIGKTTIAVISFIREVRGARNDLTRVSGELTSLQMTLEQLHDDCNNAECVIPAHIEDNLVAAIQGCEKTVKNMESLLSRHREGGLARNVQWSLSSKAEMEALRSNLEAHKLSVNMALNMIQM